MSRWTRMLAVVVVAASTSMATFALSGSASAATLAIKCSAVSGVYGGPTATLSGCSGNTGGSGTLPSGSAVITWANGKTTTVSGTTCAGEGCIPGLDKTPDGTKTCATGSTEGELAGKVTADTTGSATVGSKSKAEVCVDAALKISIEPGTKAKI